MSTETPVNTTDNRTNHSESTERRSSSTSERPRRTGRVKWFGKGYGFIIDIDDPSKEYFVHHSALVVTEPTEENDYRIYKRLEKGEYIECSIYRDNDGRDCSEDVTGIRRGPLMCETNPSNNTRRQPRRRHREYHSRHSRSTSRSRSRSSRNDRGRHGRRGRRDSDSYESDRSHSRSRSR